MLYQIHPEAEFPSGTSEKARTRVVRFGSKSLQKWQKNYGPTKLELLGMTVSILACTSYLRGQHFKVYCDHAALRPLFQNRLKGAIYERWLSLLQQFNFEIQYKAATQMVVPDALSRCHPPQCTDNRAESPDEEDPFFPYVPDDTGHIHCPNGTDLKHFLHHSDTEAPQANVVAAHKPVTFGCTYVKSVGQSMQSPDYDAGSDSDDLFVPHQKPAVQTKRYAGRVKSGSHQPLHSQKSSHRPTLSKLEGLFKIISLLGACLSYILTGAQVAMQTFMQSVKQVFAAKPVITCAQAINTTHSVSAGNANAVINTETPGLQLSNFDLFQKTDFSPESISQLQYNDSVLRPVIDYLQTGTLPQSQKAARKIMLMSADYVLVGNLLFHSRIAKSKRTKSLSQYQLVCPEILIKSILELYHDSPMAGHSGIKDTLDRIKENYYFPAMTRYVTDYVKSCPQCQKRKVSKVQTKAGIATHPIPSGPFRVWQVDLYGALPRSPQNNTHIFTAVDMFSKYLVAIPIANTDAMTVSRALFQLFTTYGVCDTLISDNGSEWTSQVTTAVCKLLSVPQQFTMAFVHHTLGAVERSHLTLAERLTPHTAGHRSNWEDILPAIVFSMNNSVNTSTAYSPHEIIFGQRPSFPLSFHLRDVPFETLPPDTHVFIKAQAKKLSIIRDAVKANTDKSHSQMIARVNQNANPLSLQSGDYVWLQKEPTGTGQKLQYCAEGPFVVVEVKSAHRVKLSNPTTGEAMKNLVHINRLRPAYVREPNPQPYFVDRVLTNTGQATSPSPASKLNPLAPEFIQNNKVHKTQAETCETPVPTLRRSARQIKPPERYGIPLDPTYSMGYDTVGSDETGFHKIKRVLGQRHNNNQTEFLVHLRGEPSQNAIWVPLCKLNAKAQRAIQQRPPPILDG